MKENRLHCFLPVLSPSSIAQSRDRVPRSHDIREQSIPSKAETNPVPFSERPMLHCRKAGGDGVAGKMHRKHARPGHRTTSASSSSPHPRTLSCSASRRTRTCQISPFWPRATWTWMGRATSSASRPSMVSYSRLPYAKLCMPPAYPTSILAYFFKLAPSLGLVPACGTTGRLSVLKLLKNSLNPATPLSPGLNS